MAVNLLTPRRKQFLIFLNFFSLTRDSRDWTGCQFNAIISADVEAGVEGEVSGVDDEVVVIVAVVVAFPMPAARNINFRGKCYGSDLQYARGGIRRQL